MKRHNQTLVLAGSILTLGLIAMAHGQNDFTGLTVEERLMRLERNITTIDNQLQQRTSAAGPDDRTTRDINLETRLNNIELAADQLGRQVSDLQRQIAAAERAANQAQRDAQMAQQIARNAEARTR